MICNISGADPLGEMGHVPPNLVQFFSSVTNDDEFLCSSIQHSECCSFYASYHHLLPFCITVYYFLSNFIKRLCHLVICQIVIGTSLDPSAVAAWRACYNWSRLNWAGCRCTGYLNNIKNYNIAVTAFKVLTTQQPNYFANIIRFRAASHQLRSCGRNLLHDDCTNLAFADCAFSHATPAVWNSLTLEIVSDLSCLAAFKRLVKTELHNRAYLLWLVTSRTYDSSLCEWLNLCYQVINRVIIIIIIIIIITLVFIS